MLESLPDALPAAAHALYASLAFRPPPGHFTVLAAFALTRPASEPPFKLIALATGSKCLPAARLPPTGDALHDSHAEVLAHRAAVRWLLEEVQRAASASVPDGGESPWLVRDGAGMYALREEVELVMYTSSIPCGDASTRLLASLQPPDMALLKSAPASHSHSTSPSPPLSAAPYSASPTPARGRTNYALLGVLRTKPARADAPPTLSMACSDKLAMWAVLGMQGALGARVLRPVYVRCVVLGAEEVPEGMSTDGVGGEVREDCERALGGRVWGVQGLPGGYAVHLPTITFTRVPFVHSRTTLDSETGVAPARSSNDSLCWWADSRSGQTHDVLINGLKRGVSPKFRHRDRFRPQLCKVSMFQLYRETLSVLGMPLPPDDATYFQVKHPVATATVDPEFETNPVRLYQLAKHAVRGARGAPFAGWVISGQAWEGFNWRGVVRGEGGGGGQVGDDGSGSG